ncbi:hypothetical protein FJY68_07330 [candidate division WOR-3 bacterium]|uniref:Uncharacterized protein n=1 Tax=candidate division WOR-3 bacterium TaxID=2052148 RepID=A0A938BPZ0_UNCW3|nr:hypothetical protein [candidate division WOR-3 bacterium]
MKRLTEDQPIRSRDDLLYSATARQAPRFWSSGKPETSYCVSTLGRKEKPRRLVSAQNPWSLPARDTLR